MVTTRFIIGVPVAAAITFGLFVFMRSLIAGDGAVPQEIYQDLPVIIIGPRMEDSPTETNDLDPPEEPETEVDRPDPPTPDPDSLDPVEDGMGPDFVPEPPDGTNPRGDICGQPVIRIAPTYPRRAAEQGIEGYAVVEFTVKTDGGVKDAVVVDQAPGTFFGSAAVKAVERWRYEPCKVNGRVQEVRLQVQLIFELDES